MSSENFNRCMFIGLPHSGKSSFIGALWHIIESNEINTLYSITTLPEDREYLNRLKDSFLNCKSVERTKTDHEKKLKLDIKENTTGKQASFIFPDLSGETYESQFENRKLTIDYLEQVTDCNSLMLFVNPDKIKKSFLISQTEDMLIEKDTSNNVTQAENKEIILDTEGIKWNPKLCQTQVVLVDLLQMIENKLRKPCKINIIISAWDVIKNHPDQNLSKLNPDQWFLQQLPLLFQFLTSNERKFEFKVFGISAQGGKYSKIETENLHLQQKIKQSERIIVQSADSISHDLTVPLKWLFE